MALLKPPTKEQLKAIRDEIGINEETIRRRVEEIHKWLKEQPHLPNGHDYKRLEILLLNCKGDLQKMKKSLDIFYTMRNNIREILCGRDPEGDWFKDIKDVIAYVPLPTVTDDMNRVMFGVLLDPTMSKHNPNHILRIASMVQDMRYFEEFCPNDIYIMDLKNVTMGHIMKYSFTLVKAIHDFGLIGYRVHYRQGHFINAPVYLDIIIGFLKLIVKPKIFQRIHVHRHGLGNLLDYVPQSILPQEYGGEAGPIKDIWGAWLKKVESNRAWFLEQDTYIADESKRPKKKHKRT